MLLWSAEVHQAVGMIAAQMDACVVDAAERLVRESEETIRCLEDIAPDVLSSTRHASS
jgi:hypothetical protein